MNYKQNKNEARMIVTFVFTILVLFINHNLQARTWHVPAEISTIKEAVEDSASYGDTVLVASGSYNTATGEVFPINMKNGVVLISESGPAVTIIDANSSAQVIGCQALDSTTVLSGFTITGGSATNAGGIYCSSSFMTINNNIVKENVATGSVGCGGGIYCYSDNSKIVNNMITENTAVNYMGGGIYYHYSNGIIEGNTVSKNTSRYGGGIFNESSAPLITRNIVAQNHALETGGGLDCYWYSDPDIVANVIIDNTSVLNGAGIACCYHCSPTIYNNTIARNIGQYGGGIRTLGDAFVGVYTNAIMDNVDGLYLTVTSDAMIANHNNIYFNLYQQGGYEVINNTSYTLDMTSNYWWTTDPSIIDSLIFGLVNFTPFLSVPYSNAPGEPSSVNSVTVMSDSTYTTPLMSTLSFGDTLFIQLQGTSWNNAFVDPAMVIISSNKDTYGIAVALIETDTATGTYQGMAFVDTISNDLYNRIGVNQQDTVIIKANVDLAKQDSVVIDATGVFELERNPANKITTLQNYPNPFNEKTEIAFCLLTPGCVTLRIFDAAGRLVKTLDAGMKREGLYKHQWDGRDNKGREVESGVYFCQLEKDKQTEEKSIVYLKGGRSR